MTRTIPSLIFALLLVSIGCSHTDNSASINDHEVYIDFIQQMGWAGKLVVIKDTTTFYRVVPEGGSLLNPKSLYRRWKFRRRAFESLTALENDTFDSFLSRQASVSLDPAGFAGLNTYLISDEEVSAIFTRRSGGDGYWPEFYEKYPDAQGICTLSRAGVNAAGTQTLLYYGNQSYGLAGIGELVLLQKTTDGWEIAGKMKLWIS